MLNNLRNAASTKEKMVLGNEECISLIKTLFRPQKKVLIQGAEDYLKNAESRIANDTLNDEAEKFTISEMKFNKYKKDGDKDARAHIYKDISKEHYIEKITNLNSQVTKDKRLSEAAIEWLKNQSEAVIYTIYFNMELSRPLEGIKLIDMSELYDKPLKMTTARGISGKEDDAVRPVSEGAMSLADRDIDIDMDDDMMSMDPEEYDVEYFYNEINEIKDKKMEQLEPFTEGIFRYLIDNSELNGYFDPNDENALLDNIQEIVKEQLETRRYDIAIDDFYDKDDMYREGMYLKPVEGCAMTAEELLECLTSLEGYDGTLQSIDEEQLLAQGIEVEHENNEKESIEEFLGSIICGNDAVAEMLNLGMAQSDINNFINRYFDNHKIDIENSVEMMNIETVLEVFEDNIKYNIISNFIDNISLKESEGYKKLLSSIYKDEYGNDCVLNDILFNKINIHELLFMVKNYELIGAKNIFKAITKKTTDQIVDMVESIFDLESYKSIKDMRNNELSAKEYMLLEEMCYDYLLDDESKKKIDIAMISPGKYYELLPKEINVALKKIRDFLKKVE